MNFKQFSMSMFSNKLDCYIEEKNYYKKIAEQCVQQLILTEDVRYSEERSCYYWVSTGQEVGEDE